MQNNYVSDFSLIHASNIQGDQLNICNLFIVRYCTLDKSVFTRYQKNTAMFTGHPVK